MVDSMISTNCLVATDYSSDKDSGWSFYLEDSSAYISDAENYEASGSESSSMVSDAACCSAPKKHRIDRDHHSRISSVGVSLTTSCERRTYKRRKTKVVYMDPDLEDTACSSASRPREHNFSNLHSQEEHQGIYFGIPQEQSNSSDQLELVGKERNCTELGRKGLCLVPVSMLFHCVS